MKIDKRIAFKASTIKAILEDQEDPTCEEDAVPVLFDESVLKEIFTFIQYEADVELLPEIPKPVPSDRISDFVPQWFANFINNKSLEDIYDVIAAANYLDVPSLIELGCAKVGCLMREKSIPELRKMFNIVNDYTPEEE